MTLRPHYATTPLTPTAAQLRGYQIHPSPLVGRGAVTVLQPTGPNGPRIACVHPLDAIKIRYPDDPIEYLEHALAWLVERAIERFDTRTRYREATGR